MTVRDMAACARQAAWEMAVLPDALRRRALLQMAGALEAEATRIFEANARDMARAAEEGLAAPLAKRLRFDGAKLADACAGLRALAALPGPARPHAAGHRAGRRGWSCIGCPVPLALSASFSNRARTRWYRLPRCARAAATRPCSRAGAKRWKRTGRCFPSWTGRRAGAGLPAGWAALLETREDVGEMLALDDWIDLIIPRGSNAFVRYIMDHSRIPVLGHADGVCHVYVDRAADIDMAVRVCVDSKAQYVAVCNAAETLLVHRDIAPRALPPLADALRSAGVALRGCARTQALIPCEAATDADWDTEYLDYILSVRIVDSLEEAIAHINRHGSGHTDAIVTQDEDAARAFLSRVDSAGVYWNCSTRFADGYRYGFGAEVGIATGKLHARGPMGIEGLCSYKYKLLGHGQTVGGGVRFTHRPCIAIARWMCSRHDDGHHLPGRAAFPGAGGVRPGPPPGLSETAQRGRRADLPRRRHAGAAGCAGRGGGRRPCGWSLPTRRRGSRLNAASRWTSIRPLKARCSWPSALPLRTVPSGRPTPRG